MPDWRLLHEAIDASASIGRQLHPNICWCRPERELFRSVKSDFVLQPDVFAAETGGGYSASSPNRAAMELVSTQNVR